jgi:hypothetical protein
LLRLNCNTTVLQLKEQRIGVYLFQKTIAQRIINFVKSLDCLF